MNELILTVDYKVDIDELANFIEDDIVQCISDGIQDLYGTFTWEDLGPAQKARLMSSVLDKLTEGM